jgi:tryptophan synthase beta chain
MVQSSAFEFAPMPDAQGMFGEYGGQLVPPHLKAAMDEIASAVRGETQGH